MFYVKNLGYGRCYFISVKRKIVKRRPWLNGPTMKKPIANITDINKAKDNRDYTYESQRFKKRHGQDPTIQTLSQQLSKVCCYLAPANFSENINNGPLSQLCQQTLKYFLSQPQHGADSQKIQKLKSLHLTVRGK